MGLEVDTSDEEREDPDSEHPNTESAEDDESTTSENERSSSFVFEPRPPPVIISKSPDVPKPGEEDGSATGKSTNASSCHQTERRARVGK